MEVSELMKKLTEKYKDIINDFRGGYWNCRLIEKTSSFTDKSGKTTHENYYEIHEIYYGENNQIVAWSEGPMHIYFETKRDPKDVIRQIKDACKHTILKIETDEDGERLVDTGYYLKDIENNRWYDYENKK